MLAFKKLSLKVLSRGFLVLYYFIHNTLKSNKKKAIVYTIQRYRTINKIHKHIFLMHARKNTQKRNILIAPLNNTTIHPQALFEP